MENKGILKDKCTILSSGTQSHARRVAPPPFTSSGQVFYTAFYWRIVTKPWTWSLRNALESMSVCNYFQFTWTTLPAPFLPPIWSGTLQYKGLVWPKSEAMVLSRKPLYCSLQVENESNSAPGDGVHVISGVLVVLSLTANFDSVIVLWIKFQFVLVIFQSSEMFYC